MQPPTLYNASVVLQPYTRDDEDRFVEMTLDEESMRFMGGSSGNEQDERVLFRKGFDIYASEDDRWFWIWGIYRNGKLCGHLELKDSKHTNADELEIVYMMHPDSRRQGIMTAALDILKHYQSEWNRRIIATVKPENIASVELLMKWGIEKSEIVLNEETQKNYLKLTLSP